MKKLNVYFEIPSDGKTTNLLYGTSFVLPLSFFDKEKCFEMNDERFLPLDTFLKNICNVYQIYVNSLEKQLSSIISYIHSTAEFTVKQYCDELLSLHNKHDVEAFNNKAKEFSEIMKSLLPDIKIKLDDTFGCSKKLSIIATDSKEYKEQVVQRFDYIKCETDKLQNQNLGENDIKAICDHIAQTLEDINTSLADNAALKNKDFLAGYVYSSLVIGKYVDQHINLSLLGDAEANIPEESDDKQPGEK
jgi:hypothetical protein